MSKARLIYCFNVFIEKSYECLVELDKFSSLHLPERFAKVCRIAIVSRYIFEFAFNIR